MKESQVSWEQFQFWLEDPIQELVFDGALFNTLNIKGVKLFKTF